MKVKDRIWMFLALALFFLFIGTALFWYFMPGIYIFELGIYGGEEEAKSQEISNKLYELGPRSIRAIINGIRVHSPFERGYSYLPGVLARFGNEGRKELILAIQRSCQDKGGVYLNYVLMDEFNDFSMLDSIIEYKGYVFLSPMSARFYDKIFKSRFGDVPVMLDDKKISEDFLGWWKVNKEKVLNVHQVPLKID